MQTNRLIRIDIRKKVITCELTNTRYTKTTPWQFAPNMMRKKRVFDLMKKFLYIVGTITAIVVFLLLLVNSPALITQTGAIGIIALVPVLLAATAFTGFYVGTVPAGYIAAWRAIKRSKLFVWGNALGLLLIATLLLSIPAASRPCLPSPVVEGVKSQASA